jgi:hypothetical protein
MGGVALACPGIGRHGQCDLCQIRGAQFDVGCPKRLGDPLARAGAGQRHNILALREDPRDGKLGDARSFCSGELAQSFDELEIFFEIFALETGARTAEILFAGEGLAPVTADEAARKPP